jgi:hypothetical protein
MIADDGRAAVFTTMGMSDIRAKYDHRAIGDQRDAT